MDRKRWYSLVDIARLAGYCIIPAEGAWVCIMGAGQWPRGRRLIPAHREIGIQHLDVYWAMDEQLTFTPKVNRYRRRGLNLPAAIGYDVSQGKELGEAIKRAVDDFRRWLVGSPLGTGQVSTVGISHPHPNVRFFNSEVRMLTSETIRLLLEADQVDVVQFGQSAPIVFADAARELADAYQMDGLTKAQAYQEIIGLGVMEPTGFIPQWFYRPRGWFRERFCEEGEEGEEPGESWRYRRWPFGNHLKVSVIQCEQNP